jgi:hypothetical protein
MDRRRLISTGIASAMTIPIARMTGAIAAVFEDITAGHPLVWDLEPGAGVPTSYPDYLTEAEKLNSLKLCSGKRPRADCFPILEGELSRTNRSFRTYSLFLISNPSWLGPDSDAQLIALYKAYEGFARAIGNDHAAVFFWKKAPKKIDGKPAGADLASLIDASRCTEYEKGLQLDISASPHVLVTKTSPNPTTPLGEYVLIQLNGLSPAATETLIGKLAVQLVDQKLNQDELNSDRWWLTWRDVATSIYQGFANIVGHSKMKIKGGPVQIEMDGTK